MARGTRGSAFNNPVSGMFDYKPSSMSNFGFDTQVGSLTGNNYSDFDLGKNIFSPEEKKNSGPFNFLRDQISKLNKSDDEDDELPDYLKGSSYKPKKESSKDMLAKFILERGLGGGSGAQNVATGLTLTGQGGGLNQPIVVAGKEGSGGFMGALRGGLGGFIQGGVPGAIAGGTLGLIS